MGTNLPLANPLDVLVGYQLRRISAGAMVELTRDLSPLLLTPAEASILLLVEANTGVNQSEIGRVLGIKRANMAPLTRALSMRALVQRTQTDGRSQGLAVTDEGAALACAAKAVMDAHDARLLERLPAAMRAELIATLRALRTSHSEG